MDKISLFQTQRTWEIIKEEVFDLVEMDHSRGRAQNSDSVVSLEQKLAQWFGRKHCISMACCSDALTASMMCLDIPFPSRVAVSDYTFIASAHSIHRAGHQAISVDVEQNYCIDFNKVPQCSAVLAVDIFGNMTKIPDTNLPVIVDAAQSLESCHEHTWSASRGTIGCISFSPSKTISSWGSGGAALTDDDDIAEKLRYIRLHGKKKNDEISRCVGMNSTMSSFEASCVLVGLRFQPQWHHRREQISRYIISRSRYDTALDLTLDQHTWHKLVFRSDESSKIISKLRSSGIEAVKHYSITVHQEPFYHGNPDDFPISRRLSDSSFTVPNQHTLTDAEVEKIADCLE